MLTIVNSQEQIMNNNLIIKSKILFDISAMPETDIEIHPQYPGM